MRPCIAPTASSRRGSVTPLAVLCLAMLLAVVALVVDGGSLMEDRRHVQATADAAALAAADDLFANYITNQGTDPKGTAQTSALTTAAANGYTNDGVQSIVTVNISPSNYQGGPNAGNPLPPGYVEVLVQYNAARLFSGVFGTSAVPVRARAVARGQWGPVSNQVMALNLTTPVGVGVGGNGTSTNVNINGGLLVNSNSSTAVTVAPGASLTAASLNLNSGGGGLLGVVGSLLGGLLGLLGGLLGGGGGGGGSSSPAPVNYGLVVPDPLRLLPPPSSAQLPTQSTSTLNITSGSVSLSPGVYVGGINVSNGASVTLTPNANGTPGIYFLEGGGLNVSDTSSLTMAAGTTAGVMIYNNWQSSSDAINLEGSGSLVLTPPSSGVYQGLTIFQQRGTLTNPAPTLTISGYGNVNITGTIYVAYGNVTLEGKRKNKNNNAGGQIIADTVSASGDGTFDVNPNGQPTANMRTLGLVE